MAFTFYPILTLISSPLCQKRACCSCPFAVSRTNASPCPEAQGLSRFEGEDPFGGPHRLDCKSLLLVIFPTLILPTLQTTVPSRSSRPTRAAAAKASDAIKRSSEKKSPSSKARTPGVITVLDDDVDQLAEDEDENRTVPAQRRTRRKNARSNRPPYHSKVLVPHIDADLVTALLEMLQKRSFEVSPSALSFLHF